MSLEEVWTAFMQENFEKIFEKEESGFEKIFEKEEVVFFLLKRKKVVLRFCLEKQGLRYVAIGGGQVWEMSQR